MPAYIRAREQSRTGGEEENREVQENITGRGERLDCIYHNILLAILIVGTIMCE
jgi:hypothetical protein